MNSFRPANCSLSFFQKCGSNVDGYAESICLRLFYKCASGVPGIILVKVVEQQVMFLFGEPGKLIFHAGSIGQDSATDK